jgi:hypothetical protein
MGIGREVVGVEHHDLVVDDETHMPTLSSDYVGRNLGYVRKDRGQVLDLVEAAAEFVKLLLALQGAILGGKEAHILDSAGGQLAQHLPGGDVVAAEGNGRLPIKRHAALMLSLNNEGENSPGMNAFRLKHFIGSGLLVIGVAVGVDDELLLAP